MAIKAADQVTVLDVTDAYSVILTSEAYTFVGDTSGAPAGLSCSTDAVAYCGNNQCPSVTVDAKAIVCPTGISATVTNSGTKNPTITFTTTSKITAACEATIPVSVDGITINKKFSFAVAKAGTNGANGKDGTSVTITSQSVTYQASSNGTTAPTGTWSTNIPTVANGQFLWTKTVVNYSNGKSTTSYSVSYKGTNGTNGANGKDGTSVTITSQSVTYQASSNGTTAPTGTWSTNIPTVANGQFLWTKTVVNYSNGKSTTSYSVSYKGTNGTNGTNGKNGEDAVTLSITTSNGTIFKNNSGSTVLTANVFKGGVKQTVADNGTVSGIGTVKWYKGTTLLGASSTITVTAGDVDNSQAYTCQIES